MFFVIYVVYPVIYVTVMIFCVSLSMLALRNLCFWNCIEYDLIKHFIYSVSNNDDTQSSVLT